MPLLHKMMMKSHIKPRGDDAQYRFAFYLVGTTDLAFLKWCCNHILNSLQKQILLDDALKSKRDDIISALNSSPTQIKRKKSPSDSEDYTPKRTKVQKTKRKTKLDPLFAKKEFQRLMMQGKIDDAKYLINKFPKLLNDAAFSEECLNIAIKKNYKELISWLILELKIPPQLSAITQAFKAGSAIHNRQSIHCVANIQETLKLLIQNFDHQGQKFSIDHFNLILPNIKIYSRRCDFLKAKLECLDNEGIHPNLESGRLLLGLDFYHMPQLKWVFDTWWQKYHKIDISSILPAIVIRTSHSSSSSCSVGISSQTVPTNSQAFFSKKHVTPFKDIHNIDKMLPYSDHDNGEQLSEIHTAESSDEFSEDISTEEKIVAENFETLLSRVLSIISNNAFLQGKKRFNHSELKIYESLCTELYHKKFDETSPSPVILSAAIHTIAGALGRFDQRTQFDLLRRPEIAKELHEIAEKIANCIAIKPNPIPASITFISTNTSSNADPDGDIEMTIAPAL